MRTERKEELYPPPSSFGATGVTESQRRRGERRSFPSLRSLRIEEGGRARGKRKEGRKGSFFASVSGGENSVARKKREKETKALHWAKVWKQRGNAFEYGFSSSYPPILRTCIVSTGIWNKECIRFLPFSFWHITNFFITMASDQSCTIFYSKNTISQKNNFIF